MVTETDAQVDRVLGLIAQRLEQQDKQIENLACAMIDLSLMQKDALRNVFKYSFDRFKEYRSLEKRIRRVKVSEEFSQTIGNLIADIGSMSGELKHHKEVEHKPKSKAKTTSRGIPDSGN